MKLGRIDDGGDWRVHGRAAGDRGHGPGYDDLHVVVDDCSRFAAVGVYPDERGETAASCAMRPRYWPRAACGVERGGD